MDKIKRNKLALCSQEKCKRKKVCMRYLLLGNQDDTWIQFQPGHIKGKFYCQYFLHFNSEEAKEYIKDIYGNTFGGKINANN